MSNPMSQQPRPTQSKMPPLTMPEMLINAETLTGTNYFPHLKSSDSSPTLADLKEAPHTYKTSTDQLAAPFTLYGQNLTEALPRPVGWLWQNHLPLAGLTLLDGDHGLGKSLLALQLAAHISSGTPMPDGTPVPQSGVIIVTPDTNANTTQLQLLTALGANLDHIQILSYLPEPDPDDITTNYRPFSLPEDLTHLFNTAERINARLIILDPFINLLSTHNRWTQIRLENLLSNLNQRLIEHDIACLLIRNCTAKGGHARPSTLERSERFLTTAISRLLLAPDPMFPASPLLAHHINRHGNPSPTHSLLIQPIFDHPRLPHIAFDGSHDLTAYDLLEYRPDVLRRRLLADDLLTIIDNSPDPMHVSTLYKLLPQFSPYQIQRSLADLLRTEQIERPARGFYAKTPENPVFTPKTTSDLPLDPAAKHKQLVQEIIAHMKAERAEEARKKAQPTPQYSPFWLAMMEASEAMKAEEADPELGPKIFSKETAPTTFNATAATTPDTPHTPTAPTTSVITAATTLDGSQTHSPTPTALTTSVVTAAITPDTPQTNPHTPTAEISSDIQDVRSDLTSPPLIHSAATTPDTPAPGPPDPSTAPLPPPPRTIGIAMTPEELRKKALQETHMGELLRDQRLGRKVNWENW